MRTHTNGEMPHSDIQRDYLAIRAFLVPRGPYLHTDAILCFGCGDPSVPLRAADLFDRGLAGWIVATGFGPDHRIEPEADEFARIMTSRGVPRQRIVVERAASNIGENVVFGLAAARSHGLDVRSVTVVSHVHATRRCLATLTHRAPDVLAHPDPCVVADPGPVSLEVLAAALRELDRLRTYPSLGYITAQAEPRAVTEAAARVERHLTGASPEDRRSKAGSSATRGETAMGITG